MIGVGEGDRVGGKWELVGWGKRKWEGSEEWWEWGERERVGGRWKLVGVGVGKERVRGSENGGREKERERGGGRWKTGGGWGGKKSRGEWKMVGVERRKREWMGKNGEWQHTAKLRLRYTAFIRTYYLSQTHHKDGVPQGLQITFFFYINQECVLSDIPLMRSY